MRFLWGAAGWMASAVRFLAALYLWYVYWQFLCTFVSKGGALLISVIVYPGLFVVPFFDDRARELDGYSVEGYVLAIGIAIFFGKLKNRCLEKRRWA